MNTAIQYLDLVNTRILYLNKMAEKKTLVNQAHNVDVLEFLSSVKHKGRKEDALELLDLYKEWTQKEPVMWGRSIVGFGKYSYRRKNGDEFEWFNTGFSPGSKHLSVYVMYDLESIPNLLQALGPHSKGRGCLYIKKLSEVDLNVLREIVQKSDQWERSTK